MKEYIATGTLTLTGVTFYIAAKSLDDAWARLAVGVFDGYDADISEITHSDVNLDTIEENV